jgi:phospholipid/cholesterol/gamma-HCH transport system substrate-binding protein
MNNAQMTARVGLFFILGLALLWIVFESLGSGGLFKGDGYELASRFDNLQQLKSGDEVRISGVKVGSIRATRLADGRAEAVLKIDEGVVIPEDSRAKIAMSGLLGSNYLSVSLGSSPTPAAPGAILASDASADLNTILAQLDGLGSDLRGALSGLSTAFGGEEGGLFKRLDELVAQNSENLSKTVANLEIITAKIRGGDGTIGRLVNDPGAYEELVGALAEFKKASTQAATFIADAQGVIDEVKSGKGTLGALIYDETTGENIKATASNLRSLSERLNSGEGTFGKLLTDDTLYRDVQGLMKKADRALDGLSDQGPITAVGVAANALF